MLAADSSVALASRISKSTSASSTNGGKTTVAIAEERKHAEVAEFLRSRGAR
jgi:hypothetical protein